MIDTVKIVFPIKMTLQDLKGWAHQPKQAKNGFTIHQYRCVVKTKINATVSMAYFPYSHTKYPKLTIEFSLPKLFFGNNIRPITDLEEAFTLANTALRSLPGVPEIDIRKGEIIRLDIAYNHPVGDLIHAYIDYLSTQNYSRRKNKSYLHETVYFGANSVSLTFYNKFRECGLEEAKGLLRQEISFTNKTRIQKTFGARTLGELPFPPIKRELEKALHILRVDLPILAGGRRAGIKLIEEFGLHEGVYMYGLLRLKEIFPLKILADMGNKHPRSLNRILARLPHRGYALGMAVGEKDLPPLSIDVDILDDKRIAFIGNSNG